MKCERCTIETNTHTVSMFNTQAICMDCKETEKGHPKYKEACRTEFEEVRKGNFNFEGIGWDGLTYEDTNKGITLCGMCEVEEVKESNMPGHRNPPPTPEDN